MQEQTIPWIVPFHRARLILEKILSWIVAFLLGVVTK
jgi:hypothetical protein